MAFSLADARFLIDRASGLVRRGLASLRTRGWRASWERTKVQLRRSRTIPRATLYSPASRAFSPFALAASAHPRASIVIPVYDQFAHTLTCLRALAEHPPQTPFEVIVVDDGSSDETVSALPQVAGLRYHRRSGNGGFIAACNDGAGIARGEFLVFLNNDTVPQPGWLDALLQTFADHPDAGLVGAQLVYPDGRLQEAGGVVFHDGSAWNYGRYESPDDPRYGYLRDADYVSGAAMAIPRALFGTLGGFDTRYAPAYYEDTDLAFAVRAAGKRVLYQPSARVVHDEGVTAGTNPDLGVKACQARNHGLFARLRQEQLQSHLPAGTLPTPCSIHSAQRKVLVIDALTPHPDRDSGSLRLFNLMRLMIAEGAHVTFLPANRAHVGAYTRALQGMGVETWYAPFARRAPAWLAEHGSRFHDAFVCRHYVMREFMPLLRTHAPQARLIFDSIDLHYVRESRAARLSNDRTLALGAAKTRKRELDVIARSDMTLVVSEAEREVLEQDAPQAHVEVLSNLHEIAGPGLPFDQRRDLVFVGGFRHPPNVDAVRWFVGEVFPLVRKRLPGILFHCIGGDVPKLIETLSRTEGALIHGHVADITPYMDGCRIALAPLRFGAGVKGKINLSMAHGQPVVSTSCGIEGMHLAHGHDVLVADDASAFADAIVRLYGDECLWHRLSVNGLDNVSTHFSVDAARDVVRRLLSG